MSREKIENLKKAFQDLGINAEIDYEARMFGTDQKGHYGIVLTVDIGTYDDLEIMFHPKTYRYVPTCLDLPIRERKK